jgi:hypothetical protein
VITQDQVREDRNPQERGDDSAYEPPRLDVLGSVEELTAGGGGPDSDDAPATFVT